MKRFGYTLAEVIITLAIVGVVAAITLPMANKFMPDGNKVLYLSTYDSLVEAIHQMATNTTLYPCYDSYAYTNAPLANTSSVNVDEKSYDGGHRKFCYILASFYGEENPTCKLTTTGWDPSFTAKNGVEFMVTTIKKWEDYSILTYVSTIQIDINGDAGVNQTFSEDCQEPDRFIFEVASDGKIIASDVKGQEYLATRINTKKLSKKTSQELRNKLNITEAQHLTGEDRTKILVELERD